MRTTKRCRLNVPGEIVVRPKRAFAFFSGYYKRPEDTVEAWRNLWFHTGDRGRMDEEGFVSFLDRMKDSIRRRGENISAWEVESAINTHPAVLEAAAYGVASELSEADVMIAVSSSRARRLTRSSCLTSARARSRTSPCPATSAWWTSFPRTRLTGFRSSSCASKA